MQAAGVFVILAGKLAAGVKPGEDEFYAGDLLFGMFVDRHAASVVRDFDRTVRVQGNLDERAVTRDRFIDAVIDDFLNEVIRPTRIRVHTGTFPHRIKACEDLDICSVVFRDQTPAPTPERAYRSN
jgi:hypothetical protein